MADGISSKWTGHDLLDVNGEKIGVVEDVRVGEVKATDDALVVPFPKDRVKGSPGVDDSAAFSADEERQVCAYYGLEYVSEFGSPVEGCADEEDVDEAQPPASAPSRA